MSAIASLSQKYSHIAIFVFCEIIAFFLIINFNHHQRDIFLHSSSLFSGRILETTTDMKDFVNLREANEELQRENAELLQDLITRTQTLSTTGDTTLITYDVIPAKVVNNSIMSMRNHLTVNVGSEHGVTTSMGVVTKNGVVGIVKKVGKNFATVLSMLHVDTRLSASIKNENFFGTTSWDGTRYNQLSLSDIPTHATIAIGDSVVTNGYSTIFPKGIDVGIVQDFSVDKSGAFLEVKINPTVDFTNLDHVYLLKGNFAEELILVETNE